MFGLGFFKLLFLAAAVTGAWYLFKMLAGPKVPQSGAGPKVRERGARNAAGNARLQAEDMVACKVCGTYVAANGARSCGRGDCPWRG
jgi:hypothetical protein